MRDAVAAEAHGVPAALVLNASLLGIAAETARVAGLPRLAIVPVERPLYGLSREAIAQVALPLAGAVADTLVS